MPLPSPSPHRRGGLPALPRPLSALLDREWPALLIVPAGIICMLGLLLWGFGLASLEIPLSLLLLGYAAEILWRRQQAGEVLVYLGRQPRAYRRAAPALLLEALSVGLLFLPIGGPYYTPGVLLCLSAAVWLLLRALTTVQVRQRGMLGIGPGPEHVPWDSIASYGFTVRPVNGRGFVSRTLDLRILSSPGGPLTQVSIPCTQEQQAVLTLYLAGAVPSSLPAPPAEPPLLTDTFPALDVIMTEEKERLSRLDASSGALEGKATFVFTAATLLLTSVGGAQAALGAHPARHLLHLPNRAVLSFVAADVLQLMTVGAVAIYGWIVVHAWQAYMVRTFRDTEPVPLLDYRRYQDYEAKTLLSNMMADRYTINAAIVQRKSWAVGQALRGLFCEVIYLALLLLLSIVL